MPFQELLILCLVWVAFRASGCGFGLCVLAGAVVFWAQEVVPHPSLVQMFALVLLIVSVPLAGFFAGVLSEKFCLKNIQGRIFRQVATLLATLYMIETPLFSQYLGLVKYFSAPTQTPFTIAFFLSLTGNIGACAAMIALCLMFTVLIAEIPMRWFSAAAGFRAAIPYELLRPNILILTLCLTLQLIAGLLTSELSLTSLLSRK